MTVQIFYVDDEQYDQLSESLIVVHDGTDQYLRGMLYGSGGVNGGEYTYVKIYRTVSLLDAAMRVGSTTGKENEMASDLPPGVSPSDIPGNRPEDEWFDVFHDNIAVPDDLVAMDPRSVSQLVSGLLIFVQTGWKEGFDAGVRNERENQDEQRRIEEDESQEIHRVGLAGNVQDILARIDTGELISTGLVADRLRKALKHHAE